MEDIVLRFVMAATVMVICVSCAFGQAKEGGDASVQQTIMRIEKEMLNAILKGDASANEKYLAETATLTGPDGNVIDKTQAVNEVKTGVLKLQAASLDAAKVQVYGDTAIVTYSSNDKGTYKGKDITGQTRWTDVFVRRNGQWQLVAGHGSSVAKQ
jgi:ketosteroid isomerase-like protein